MPERFFFTAEKNMFLFISPEHKGNKEDTPGKMECQYD
jgi:hypothetical protein